MGAITNIDQTKTYQLSIYQYLT